MQIRLLRIYKSWNISLRGVVNYVNYSINRNYYTHADDLDKVYLSPLHIMTCLETGDTHLEIVDIPINTLSNLARRYLIDIPCRPSEASMQKSRLVRCGPDGIVTRKVLCNRIPLAK
jgi:hypothetical protein